MTKKDVKLVTGAIIIIMIAIIVSLVYAAFTGQLSINGTAVGRDSNWDIHFENVSSITTTGSAKVLNNHQPVINSNNRTEINDYEVSLTSPNDTISFTFDAVNGGNYNAKITSLSVGTPQCTSTDSVSAVNMCNNLTYTLTYDSGATVQTNDVLYAKDKLSFKVTLKFNDISNPDLLPKAGVSISNLGIQINFEQEGSALVKDNGEVANYKVYHQGDKITLNNEDYWVIEDSGVGQDYVVALKDLPLTVSELNTYGGVGTDNNHVNKYTQSSTGSVYSNFGYGGMAYYSRETCGYVNGSLDTTGCNYEYIQSDIKYVIDNWMSNKFLNNQLKQVDGYSARLINVFEYQSISSEHNWKYSSNYVYWTMTRNGDSLTNMRIVMHNGALDHFPMYSYTWYSYTLAVRPVINVYKSALETNNNSGE